MLLSFLINILLLITSHWYLGKTVYFLQNSSVYIVVNQLIIIRACIVCDIRYMGLALVWELYTQTGQCTELALQPHHSACSILLFSVIVIGLH